MSTLDLIPFRVLLDRVLEPLRRHARSLFLPVAIPLIVGVFVGISAQRRWYRIALLEGTEGPELFAQLAWLAVEGAAIVVLYGFSFGALQVLALDALAGRPLRLTRAWGFQLRPRVLWTYLLATLVVGVSFALCFFPAVYVVPLLLFTVPVMVEEGRFGVAALNRSVELTRFNPTNRWQDSGWLRSLTFLLVATLIQYALNLAVQLPFVVVQQVTVFREVAAGRTLDPATLMDQLLWLQIATQTVSVVATVAAWLYMTFGTAMLYHESRRRREGDDLAAAIDEVTADMTGDGDGL